MTHDNLSPQDVGVVVIGRNEGERLRRCLDVLTRHSGPVVYVDSASRDDSVAYARSKGVEVVELDASQPLNAARARNAGFARLTQTAPHVRFVQFVDGDCELIDGWLSAAAEALGRRPTLAIVCGRLRERRPEASVFNRLCDMEWNTAVGPMDYCGGIFMVRCEAFEQVGGFDANLPAGEEPEMCVRLRDRGWTLERLGGAMAWHDADMHRFGQWWRRNLRAGVAYAQGYRLHGRGPLRHWAKEHRSNWMWGLAIPAVAAALAWPTFGLSLLLFGLYPMQVWRVARRRRTTHGDPGSHCWRYAGFTVLGKFPNMLGQAKYWLNCVRGVRSTLIEHKRPNSASAERTP